MLGIVMKIALLVIFKDRLLPMPLVVQTCSTSFTVLSIMVLCFNLLRLSNFHDATTLAQTIDFMLFL